MSPGKFSNSLKIKATVAGFSSAAGSKITTSCPTIPVSAAGDSWKYRLSDMRDSEVEGMVLHRAEDFADLDKNPQEFLKKIYDRPDVLPLHRNPLLLTLSIALYLHRVEEKIPHNLAGFYEERLDHF